MRGTNLVLCKTNLEIPVSTLEFRGDYLVVCERNLEICGDYFEIPVSFLEITSDFFVIRERNAPLRNVC